ncbi:hypothetical protein R6Z07M_000003 [Ovis aries]
MLHTRPEVNVCSWDDRSKAVSAPLHCSCPGWSSQNRTASQADQRKSGSPKHPQLRLTNLLFGGTSATVKSAPLIMSRSCSVKHHGRVTYDADVLKTFWEKRIELHMEQLQKEDMRIRRSALDRLRDEWARQLERRNQMLQSSREAPPQPAPPGTPALRAGDQPAA